MSLFGSFRRKPGPTLYDPFKTAVTSDVLEVGFIFAAVIVFVSLLVFLPGTRVKDIFSMLLRIVLGVFVTAGIMLSNFGQEWEVSHITNTTVQYRAGTKYEIHAAIGVKIGLRSVNITLKGNPTVARFDGIAEKVDYNERFYWSGDGWHIGRLGFGPNAGSFNRGFRAAQFKGLPYPILWIAEYFTIDGEGIRWGRHYLQAGFYTHICVWLAFPLWILALITVNLVVRYGAYCMLMTGGCLLLGNILYATIRNANDLVIPFEDGTLKFSWGATFYLNLFTGLVSIIAGTVLLALELWDKDSILAILLNFDLSQDYEECYASKGEISRWASKNKTRRFITQPSSAAVVVTNKRYSAIHDRLGIDHSEANDDDDTQDDIYENPEVIQRLYKKKVGIAKRGTIMHRLGKSKKQKQRPVQMDIGDVEEGPQEIYENTNNAQNLDEAPSQGENAF